MVTSMEKTILARNRVTIVYGGGKSGSMGALADGDIGSHFPPSDMKWKGAASDKFLKYVVERVAARGGRIANLEVTLICERPKIGPLRDQMRARIAEIAELDISRVAVKATTSERLGFTGREEGIAATACATIRLPWGPADKGPVTI